MCVEILSIERLALYRTTSLFPTPRALSLLGSTHTALGREPPPLCRIVMEEEEAMYDGVGGALAARASELDERADDNIFLAKRAFTRAPCPNPQGRTVGSIEPFTVLCGVDLPGDDMSAALANNITECADICAKAQPRCYAVAFMPDPVAQNRTQNCILKGSDVPTPATQTFVMAAAIAAGPTATADSSTEGSTYTARSSPAVRFSVFCGKDYPHDDIGKVYAATMGSCMDQCAQRNNSTGGAKICRGVSYDGFQGQGFQNCFLKSTSDSGGLVEQSFSIDSALVVASSPASPSGANPTTATSPGAVSSPGTTSPAVTPSPGSSSLAWVAGPVVGGAVALLLIAGFIRFFVVRRKRRHPPVASSELDTNTTMVVSPVTTYVSPYAEVKRHELPSKNYREAAELA